MTEGINHYAVELESVESRVDGSSLIIDLDFHDKIRVKQVD